MIRHSDLAKKYGRYRVVSGGKELLFFCPKCGKEKLYFSAKTGAGFCHRCHISFFEKGSVDVFSLPVGRNLSREKARPRSETGLPKEAIPFSYLNSGMILAREITSMGQEALRYLQRRGFDLNDAIEYNLHFCASGKYAGRIIFPAPYRGRIYTYVARDFLGRKGVPKVLAPEKSKYKEENIARIGLDRCLESESDLVVVVEGPFDAMACGSPPAFALQGSRINDDLLSVLIRRFHRFVLCLDPDMAGRNGTETISEQLRMCGKGVAIITGLEGDPGSYGRRFRGILDRILLDISWQKGGNLTS